MRFFLTFLIVATSAAQVAAPAQVGASGISRADALQLGRADTKLFYQGKKGQLWEDMSSQMKEGLKSEDTLLAISSQVNSEFGVESAVLHEDAMPAPGGMMVYTRIVKFERNPSPALLTFTFGGRSVADKSAPRAIIAGFFIKPEPNPAPTEFLKYKDKSLLRFPLSGEWTIYQGGRTVGENYHSASADERFADDIVLLKDGQLYRTDGKTNADWYGFAQPVFADADGKVVKALDAYDDNDPLKPSSTNPRYGNTVVIDHGNGEFSMYAHLKRGSVLVKEGQAVKSGQPIGMTGNSGNSPFTHLHYHLQNTPEWFNGQGLPIAFAEIVLNGKPAKDAEAVRGDRVEQR